MTSLSTKMAGAMPSSVVRYITFKFIYNKGEKTTDISFSLAIFLTPILHSHQPSSSSSTGVGTVKPSGVSAPQDSISITTLYCKVIVPSLQNATHFLVRHTHPLCNSQRTVQQPRTSFSSEVVSCDDKTLLIHPQTVHHYMVTFQKVGHHSCKYTTSLDIYIFYITSNLKSRYVCCN
jgi:hypothetical protein